MATVDNDNDVNVDSVTGNEVNDDATAQRVTTTTTTMMVTTTTMTTATLMATPRWATARRDMTTMTMATGDDDND